MNKKLYGYLGMIAAVLLLGSCSRDIENAGIIKADAEAGRIIDFKTWMDKQTRAAPMTKENMTSFTLSAWQAGKTTLAADALLNAVTVVRAEKGENGVDTWTYKPKVSWPGSNTVNFYAYSPALSTNLSTALGDATTSPTIEYNLPGHYLPPSPPNKSVQYQEDFLVAGQSGSYASDGATGVVLNFRHALSRVLVKARNSSLSKSYVIKDVTLKNTKGSGTLDLSALPAAFTYPVDEASLQADGYQTYWDVSGGSTGDLSADLPSSGVLINYSAVTYESVVDGQNGLYVIPQELDFNEDILVGTEGGTSPKNQFYLEVSYTEAVNGVELGALHTYAFPIRAQVGDDRSASSIAFEIQRQYTFLLNFGDSDQPIKVKGVSIDSYDSSNDIDAIYLPKDTTILLWAGSNIYYDLAARHLTFDADSIHTNEKYQGVYFKWGGLVGMGQGANGTSWDAGPTTTYLYGGEVVSPNAVYASIPYMAPTAPANDGNSKYLLEHHDSLNFKGDICVYLSEKGYVPDGKDWRMPTQNEFVRQRNRTRSWVGAEGGITGNESGTFPVDFGVNLGNVYFPMSGIISSAIQYYNQGIDAYYWTSSTADNTVSRAIQFLGNTHAINTGNIVLQDGLSVRCVKEVRVPLPLN
ncbi:hypothetical protein FACS189411_15930 [Bacteroidia bacterium]|nr:hypothetical protein FACS189411_15930 [Bacteroidia bacterium]